MRTALRNELTSIVRTRAALFFPLIRLQSRLTGERLPLLAADTEVVVEGPHRCANSFAIRALFQPQPRRPRMAYYSHAAATVRAAARRGLPILVLTREPVSAAVSRCLKHPHVSPAHALRDFVRFHRAAWPCRDAFVVADFAQTTSDFGAVVRRLNERFESGFVPFNHTADNAAVVRRLVDQEDAVVSSGNRVTDSSTRDADESRKQAVRAELQRPRHVGLRRRAARWYELYAELSRR